MESLHLICEENKTSLNKPSESNVMYYSELNRWESKDSFRAFSIKAVIQGIIKYETEDSFYKLSQGQFLVAPKQHDVKVFFDSRLKVKSLCIDISSQTIEQAINSFRGNDSYNLESFCNSKLEYPYFFENIYSLNKSFLGSCLTQVVASIQKFEYKESALKPDWFLALAERLVFHQFEMKQYFGKLSREKLSSKKEILKRLLVGRDFIHENYLKNPAIREIAHACHMSEFHFFRSFKQVFERTPYDYMLELRLLHAKEMMEDETFSISEIQKRCNFHDYSSFSRAFKKKFLIAPIAHRKQIS